MNGLTLLALLMVLPQALVNDPVHTLEAFEDGKGGDLPAPTRGELLMNSDASYENGFQWCYGGVVAPDYGALAECYEGAYEVSSIVVDLTYTGCQAAYRVDLYLWEDEGGIPGAVLCSIVGYEWLLPGFWPDVHRNYVEIAPCCVPESWWVGVWGDWPAGCSCWFFGVDETGPGGCPMTRIAPDQGMGLPAGWQPASIVPGLEDIRAFGLGAVGTPCEPTPVRSSSWGSIKSLYGR